MKTLQQEVEEHPIIQNWKEFNEHTSASADMLKCFIAGANSEHVKREKIEFAIEQLMWTNCLINFDNPAKEIIKGKISDLEKQLP